MLSHSGLKIEITAVPLSIVFCADGSWQTIVGESPPYSARAFIKTALVRLDQYALAKVDRESPNPFILRDILKESAMHHATVFPLRHVICEGKTLYDAIRHAIFISLKDDHVLESQPYETFKWIIYQKWTRRITVQYLRLNARTAGTTQRYRLMPTAVTASRASAKFSRPTCLASIRKWLLMLRRILSHRHTCPFTKL